MRQFGRSEKVDLQGVAGPNRVLHTRTALRLRWCKYLAITAPLGFFIGLAGLVFSPVLLTIEEKAVPANAIVLLGGEPVHRPPRARKLYFDGLAPLIIVSGSGDCDEVTREFASAGIPTNAIVADNKARTTMENAENSVRILRELHATNAIIVTSWYHSRRALRCFEKQAPEIQFISMPTVADRPNVGWPNALDRQWATSEYLKLVGYLLRHGISPF